MRRSIGIGAAVTAAYVAAAELGFRVAFVAEQVTTVWAPSGIAVATLLLGGLRFWPAIWIGAFMANAATSAPLWTAPLVATGNVLEAVLAAWLLRTVFRFDPRFERVADGLTFIVVAAVGSTLISAMVGVLTLCAAHVQPWSSAGALLRDWWIGDAVGMLIVAPVILTTVSRQAWQRWDRTKAAVFAAMSVALLWFAYGSFASGARPVEYAIFPVMIAASLVGGPWQTSLVVLSASAVTIWETVQGFGPFASNEPHESLVLLQTFMAVLASTALLLSAAVAERRVTARRERDAAEELRQREHLLRLAMRGGSMGAWSRNLATDAVWWSRELEEIVGLPPGGFDRTEAGFFDVVHPDDRPAVRQAVDAAVESRSDYVIEFRFRHGNGEWRWMEGRGRAVYDADGTPRQLYGIGVDVTARKHGEMALEDAKNAAESANRLKDQFLATLSHELRTPLNVVLGYAQILQSRDLAADKHRHAVDVVQRNAFTLSQLVDDLLDMSRITTGRLQLDSKPTAVAPLIQGAVDNVRLAAEAKRIALEIDLDPDAGLVVADTTRLQQVFWNVLSNAVKFTPAAGRIVLSVRGDHTSVEIVVRDSGIGIAPELLPFVFDAFRQGPARLEHGRGGLGLGLAISKQLVELHGGTIQIASDGTGRGATVTIRLPRAGLTHERARE